MTKKMIELIPEQSSEPVPTHGGLAVFTYWKLVVFGVVVSKDSTRFHWSSDREKYKEIEYAPKHLQDTFNKLTAALTSATDLAAENERLRAELTNIRDALRMVRNMRDGHAPN